MAFPHQPPSFMDTRIWHELLAHRLALCAREDKLLGHLHKFMTPNELAMAPHFPADKAHLWDGIETKLIEKNTALIENGRHFENGGGTWEEGLSTDQVQKTELRLKRVERAITTLAHIHASSTGVPELCGPDTVLPYLAHPKPENELLIKEWLFNALLSLPGCDYFLKNERPLHNFLQKVSFGLDDEKMRTKADKLLPIVLCHGNLCTGNIIFDNNNNNNIHGGKTPTDNANAPILHSWELAYLGFGISDVAHLLLSSVNSSVRIHFVDQWVALYVHNFEQFRQIQRNRKGGGTMTRIFANKSKMERIVKGHKQQFVASLAGQLLRVLPKLAMSYRKLTDEKANWEERDGHCQGKECALLGRMIGGFEMIRKDFMDG